MKAIFFILFFVLFGSIAGYGYTTELNKPPETAKPPESAPRETLERPPQKPEPPLVRPLAPNRPNITKTAKPKQGARPEVVRPDNRRPVGAGRPAGARRIPVRRVR